MLARPVFHFGVRAGLLCPSITRVPGLEPLEGSVGQRDGPPRLGWVGSHGLAWLFPLGVSTAGDQTMMGRRWTAPTSWAR